MTVAPIVVLLVEDSSHDAELTMQALTRTKLRNRVHRATTGTDAIAFLRREGPHAAAPRPDLILLDLNLPGIDGRGVLAAIKGDEQLRDIPVVVLTGSSDENDVTRSYAMHVNAYVKKPIAMLEFIRAVDSIEHFWLQIVRLP